MIYVFFYIFLEANDSDDDDNKGNVILPNNEMG